MLVHEFLEESAALRPDKVALTSEDIRRGCAPCLESCMVPKIVKIRRELPKSPHNKVLKKELRRSARRLRRAGAG